MESNTLCCVLRAIDKVHFHDELFIVMTMLIVLYMRCKWIPSRSRRIWWVNREYLLAMLPWRMKKFCPVFPLMKGLQGLSCYVKSHVTPLWRILRTPLILFMKIFTNRRFSKFFSNKSRMWAIQYARSTNSERYML